MLLSKTKLKMVDTEFIKLGIMYNNANSIDLVALVSYASLGYLSTI